MLSRVVLTATLLVACCGVAYAASSKLDFGARLAVDQMRAIAAGRPAAPAAEEADPQARLPITAAGELDCFVIGDVTRARLEAAGARVRSVIPGGIFTVFLPVAAVDAVSAMAGVEQIQGAQVEMTNLDASVPTTNAALFRGPGPAFGGLNGAGVIVGNVDTGVDYDHEDFKNAGGNTRFLKIWDQTDGVGPPAAGFGYGSDWTAADINATTSRAKDTFGHGTHTMSIMGGDGSQIAAGSAPAFTFAGMAPMADLIAVDASTNGSFSDTGIIDGINYIFQQATSFGKPAVVNCSIGGSLGPHDGSGTFELAADALAGPGRAIVFSAGNDRGTTIHAQTHATGPGADITQTCSGANTTGQQFMINGWYNSSEVINVTVITPNSTSIGPITLGNVDAVSPGVVTANGAVYFENGLTVSSNGSREVFIRVLNQNSATQNLLGTWTFRFTAVSLGATNGQVDLWRHFSTSGLTSSFVTGNDPTHELISAISTGFNTIAAAAWTSKRFWNDCFGDVNVNFNGAVNVGNISPFSSMGPTRDNRQKPDIAAPGSAIGAAQSHDFAVACPAGPSANLPGLQHVIMQGTSMAAPHASGAIALFFEKYGSLTVPQVRTLLQQRAVVDAFVTIFGAPWNKDFGWGKLNIGDMTDPTCAVTSPNGGEILVIGASANLTWNAADAYLGVTGVDVELSRNNGGSWTTIATGIANTGTLAWTVTGPATTTARLRVTARDAAANQGVDISDGPWTIQDSQVGIEVARFRAEPIEGGIRLAWELPDPTLFSSVALERGAEAQGPFGPLAVEFTLEGTSTVAVDRAIEAGHRYFYRLAATYRSGGSTTLGPIAATAGRPITAFEITGVSPNPTAGRAVVEYAVPRAAEVQVSLYDLQGREVAVLARGPHGPGLYQASWNGELEGGPARAGMYFVRLRGPGITSTRRVVLAR